MWGCRGEIDRYEVYSALALRISIFYFFYIEDKDKHLLFRYGVEEPIVSDSEPIDFFIFAFELLNVRTKVGVFSQKGINVLFYLLVEKLILGRLHFLLECFSLCNFEIIQ